MSTTEPADPIARFQEAFARARARETGDPTAMSLATADAFGRPSVRVVLLKSVTSAGFVFFTNYESRKARELETNPVAALAIHWPSLEEQIRVEGAVVRVGDAESDAYFATRSRESQIGAWASEQSRPLASRVDLETRVAEISARFAGGNVPRPPFWGGYLVIPERIEFWHGQPSRLHDRVVYVRDGQTFRIERLYP